LHSSKEDVVLQNRLKQAALANTMENFECVFKRALEGLFIDRMGQNEEITAKFMNDKEFQDAVGKPAQRSLRTDPR
jgi:type I restriction enzyme R subunit